MNKRYNAKGRRIRRNLNKKWKCVEKMRIYRQALAKNACDGIISEILGECFDGIILQLNERNELKSYSVKKRLLRRIIEKRQAQSIHKTIGRTDNRLGRFKGIESVSNSVENIRRYQFCL